MKERHNKGDVGATKRHEDEDIDVEQRLDKLLIALPLDSVSAEHLGRKELFKPSAWMLQNQIPWVQAEQHHLAMVRLNVQGVRTVTPRKVWWLPEI